MEDMGSNNGSRSNKAYSINRDTINETKREDDE